MTAVTERLQGHPRDQQPIKSPSPSLDSPRIQAEKDQRNQRFTSSKRHQKHLRCRVLNDPCVSGRHKWKLLGEDLHELFQDDRLINAGPWAVLGRWCGSRRFGAGAASHVRRGRREEERKISLTPNGSAFQRAFPVLSCKAILTTMTATTDKTTKSTLASCYKEK